jgi:predicted regulator of Ras-like GTPase activity (Roadblock/LC7/MglB family)
MVALVEFLAMTCTVWFGVGSRAEWLFDEDRCQSLFASAQHGELAVNEVGQSRVFVLHFGVV